jgi:hypothetical protein
MLTNGQDALSGDQPAQLTIAYDDADNDGYIDGSAYSEDEMAIYRWDDSSQQWTALPTQVDKESNQLVAMTNKVSLFAAGAIPPEGQKPDNGNEIAAGAAPPPEGQQQDKGKESKGWANAGGFGCMLGSGIEPKAGPGNLIFIAALVLGAAIIAPRLARRRGKI